MTIHPSGTAPSFLYDEDCGLCTAVAEWFRTRGAACDILPLQRVDVAALGLPPERLEHEAAWVSADGVAWGAQAIAGLLTSAGFPYTLVGAFIRTLPGRLVARPVYRAVARNRARLSHLLGFRTCAIRPGTTS